MTNCADSEEFMLLSGPRTGLKREFAFALKAQAELFGYPGRTRASRAQKSECNNGVLGNSSNKKLKTCSGSDSSSFNNELDKNLVVNFTNNEEQKSDKPETSKEESNLDTLKSHASEEAKTNLDCLVGSSKTVGNGAGTSSGIDGNGGKKKGLVEKPLLVYTRSRKGKRLVMSDSVTTSGSSSVSGDVSKDEVTVLVDVVKNDKVETGDVRKNEAMVTVENCEDEGVASANVRKNEAIAPVVNCEDEGVTSADVCKDEAMVTGDDCGNVGILSTDVPKNEAIVTVENCEDEGVTSADICKDEAKVTGDNGGNEGILSADVCKDEAMVMGDNGGNEGILSADVCKDEAMVTGDDGGNEGILSADVRKNEAIVTVENCEDEGVTSADICKDEAMVMGDNGGNEGILSADVCKDEAMITVENCGNKAILSADVFKDEAMVTGDDGKSETIITANVCKDDTIVMADNCGNEAIASANVCKDDEIVAVDHCKNQNIISADVCQNEAILRDNFCKIEKIVVADDIKIEAILSADVCKNGDIQSTDDCDNEFILPADVSKTEAIVSADVCKNGVLVPADVSKNDTIVVSADVYQNEGTAVSDDVCMNDETAEGEGKITDKLDMKMSGTIAITKCPSKTKELLDTGLLEGLPIKYIFAKKKEGLKGTIKGCEILCFCSSCKGCKIVTPLQFERHAGSGNKRAPDYIYLDNGNTIRDVLNACKDAPLDTLEATIRNAICSPVQRATVCQNCKGPLPASRIIKTAILCTQCLELKKSQASPACLSGTSTRSSRSALTPKSSEHVSKCASRENKSNGGKLTKKDLSLHKLVFGDSGLPDGAELAYYIRGQELLTGYKKGSGIFCHHCNTEVSPSAFEAHAGWASRRKPYLNIYTSNGVSLHELSVSLTQKGREFSSRDNDDLCSICADFGDLLLCDGCPRAFHRDCVGLSIVPPGKWYCSYCQLMFQKQKFWEHHENAKAAGRVSGEDPIEQISQRCIRTVKTSNSEVGGCALCRSHGFSRSGFGPRTVLLCDQCEKEYHVGCLKDHKMADLRELPEGNWFCCTDCDRIHSSLKELLDRGPEKLPDSLSHVIKAKHVKGTLDDSNNLELRWTLLSGQNPTTESRVLLSKAVAIFHERFDPIIDSKSGRDLIPSMVYGRNIKDQDFGAMYCAVLTANSTVVSAGILRIFGREFAELPLVATSSENQGQGYFQSLFSCIEKLLQSLNVKNLVLPAAEEAESIWTNKFGFKKMTQDQLRVYRRDSQMMIFQGTSMLEKPVPSPNVENSTDMVLFGKSDGMQ